MDKDRLMHSYNVGLKMIEIGKEYNLSDSDLDSLFVLGLVHDIGYQFSKDTSKHGEVGANILKEQNYKYYKEVYYHGIIEEEYSSLFLDILNMADMQIDKYGNDVGYEKRLEDIKNRYGENSITYINARKSISKVSKNNY